MRNSWALMVLSTALAACGGATDASGGSGLTDGGATGGQTGSGGASAGGVTASGGVAGSGGVGTGGSPMGGGGSVGTGGATIDCSMVGCSPPPMCDTGCTAPCGCCPCAEGSLMGSYVCTGGCYAPIPTDAGVSGCLYNGQTYAVGTGFPAGDGCNTCSCMQDGNMACTKIACTCDPTAEQYQKKYMSTDPAQCQVIDFMCPVNTTYFSNTCGCGCMQDPSCPSWFNCMPGPGAPACDVQQIQAQCPYSGIAF